jgi:hypothetical protein
VREAYPGWKVYTWGEFEGWINLIKFMVIWFKVIIWKSLMSYVIKLL